MAQTEEKYVNVAPRSGLVTRHISNDTVIGHTDGAWHKGNLIGGLGWAFHRNEASGGITTVLEHGSQSELYVSSPLMAEALAMRLAIEKAMERGILKIVMHSDTLILINAITSGHPIKEIIESSKTSKLMFLCFRL
ncbi:unnamed protein product [Arabis nemorensis]|uniref:RNase H type-1 domain-containing protein n=1 Tax=Arabis nemorensis TaxID=586526 RepID=A0A565AUQ8_9BRAS|nr:unnamed protein product [Arabis nemorensis]